MLENGIATGELYPSIVYHEPRIVAKCACGCGEEIYQGYEHISYDDKWYYDTACLLKAIGAEWREATE